MVEQEILNELIGPITNPEFVPQPEPDYGPDCSGPDVNPREG